MSVFISYPVAEEGSEKFITTFTDDVIKNIKSQYGDDHDLFAFGRLEPGIDYSKSIDDYLSRSTIFLPFTSFNYFESTGDQGCLYEYEKFKALNPFGHIIPLQLNGESYSKGKTISDRAKPIAEEIDRTIRYSLKAARTSGRDSKSYREAVNDVAKLIHDKKSEHKIKTDVALTSPKKEGLEIGIENVSHLLTSEKNISVDLAVKAINEKAEILLHDNKNDAEVVREWSRKMHAFSFILAMYSIRDQPTSKIKIFNNSKYRVPTFEIAADWGNDTFFISEKKLLDIWKAFKRESLHFQKGKLQPLDRPDFLDIDPRLRFIKNGLEYRVPHLRAYREDFIELEGWLITENANMCLDLEVTPLSPDFPEDFLVNNTMKVCADSV